MKRPRSGRIVAVVFAAVSAVSSGCVCTSGGSAGAAPPPGGGPPPPPPQTFYSYVGGHPIPAHRGGGWDATPGRHAHDYAPDPANGYRQDGNHFRWTGAPPSSGGSTGGVSSHREGTPGASGSGSTPVNTSDEKKDEKKDGKDDKKDGKDGKKDDKKDGTGRPVR